MIKDPRSSVSFTVVVLMVSAWLLACSLVTSCHYKLSDSREESKEEKLREITDDLYDVFALGDQKAWVIGYYGSIYFTDNDGISWKKQESGTREALYGICFVNDRQGWICGGSGTLLTTGDGGQIWSRQESGTEKHLFDIHFVDPLHGMAVGYYGTILRTHDGGQSWQDISPGEDISLNALDLADESTGWIVGEFARVLHTDDFGNTWTHQRVPIEEASLFGVDFASRTTGYITGIDGIILKTDDGGSSWMRQESHTTDPLFSIKVTGDKAWAVGLRGTALHSNTSTIEWQPIMDMRGVWGWLRAVNFSGPKAGWIVGTKGMIFRTSDGERWIEITP